VNWLDRRVLKIKRPLVEDGVGAHFGVCNLCGRTDFVFPTSQLVICPRCLRKGDWDWKRDRYRLGMRIIRGLARCDICGRHFIGGGIMVSQAWACFRCLWTKLGRKNRALRPYGERIV